MNKVLTVTLVLLALFAFGASAAARRGSRVNITQELKEALNINATEVQEHIDMVFLFGGIYLSSPESQVDVVEYLRRARNVASLLNVTSVRGFVLETVDDVFDVLESLRREFNQTVNRIVALRRNGTERQYAESVRSQIRRLESNASNQLQNLLNRSQERLLPVVFEHFFAYEVASNETKRDVQNLISLAIGAFSKHARSFFRKIEIGVKVLEIMESMKDEQRSEAIEAAVRRVARNLNRQVQSLDLRYFRNISSEALGSLFSAVSNLQDEIISVSDRALLAEANISLLNSSDSPQDIVTPGSVVFDRLNQLREGLGEQVVAFRDRAVNRLEKLVRDTIKALGFRNLPSINDRGFERAAKDLFKQIQRQVEDLVSTINRIYRL
jgi:hypothetical protein